MQAEFKFLEKRKVQDVKNEQQQLANMVAAVRHSSLHTTPCRTCRIYVARIAVPDGAVYNFRVEQFSSNFISWTIKQS